MTSPRSVLYPDTEFYSRLRAENYQTTDKFVIEPASAKTFLIDKGHAFRIIQEDGPQPAEVAVWHAGNYKEVFGAMRNRVWEGIYVQRYTRLWSEVPWLRPMMTCTEDTVVSAGDGWFHHRLWTQCSQETLWNLPMGLRAAACRTTILRAVEPFGLTARDLRDNLVLFQKFRVSPEDGRLFFTTSDCKTGDYVEFYAEIDLLVAVSTCPVNAASHPAPPSRNSLLPLGIEIFETGLPPNPSPIWTNWRSRREVTGAGG